MRFVNVDEYNKGEITVTTTSVYGAPLTLHFTEMVSVDGLCETFLYATTTVIHDGRVYRKNEYFAQPTKFDKYGQASEIMIYELNASEIESAYIAYCKANIVLMHKYSKRAQLSREITAQRKHIKKLYKELDDAHNNAFENQGNKNI